LSWLFRQLGTAEVGHRPGRRARRRRSRHGTRCRYPDR
jgi:hypothetical protein